MFRTLSSLFILVIPLSLFSQTKLSRIAFSGNEYFGDEQLKNMMALKSGSVFVKEQFELDLKNIIKNYQKAGYLNCRISKIQEEYSFDSSAVSLNIGIDEGKQVLIGEISFEGNKLFDSVSLLGIMFTKPGKVLDISILNQDIEHVLNKYEQKGFAFAQVSVKEISNFYSAGAEKLRIILKIDENEKIRANNISIEGNTTTKDYVILRELRLGKNNIITQEIILDIKQRLENLGYFESVEQPKLYKYNDRTVLKIKVKEGNTNTFDGIIGYTPPAGDESGYFTGFINLSLRNLFGTGRTLEARWQKEFKQTQELELKYTEPWFLGYPVNIGTGFLQRIQDSTYVKRIVNGKAEALISKHFSTSLVTNYERVIPTIESNQFFFTVFDSRLLSAGLEIKYDSRDYIYNPASGILYKTSYSVGQKKIYNASSFTGLKIPENFNIHRILIDLDFYHSFFRRQSSLISLHGGEVKSSKFEDADYFRVGGIHSVRGYRENQFLASRVGWANVELRYGLTRKSFASVFYDFGYYMKPEDVLTIQGGEQLKIPGQQAFIFGYGLGIRVETQLGILGVSYALGKGDGILEGKVHFGIINDF